MRKIVLLLITAILFINLSACTGKENTYEPSADASQSQSEKSNMEDEEREESKTEKTKDNKPEEKYTQKQAFDEYKAKDLKILEFGEADIDGDEIEEIIIFSGQKDENEYISDLNLAVHNGETGEIIHSIPIDFEGYMDHLIMYDFTGDEISDVLLSIHSGGTSGAMMHYIYTFADGTAENIVPKLSEMLDMPFEFVSMEEVFIALPYANKGYIVNLTEEEIRACENYEFDSPAYYRFNTLTPVDVDNDGTYEVEYETTLILSAVTNSESIADIKSTFKYKNGSWKYVSHTLTVANGTGDAKSIDLKDVGFKYDNNNKSFKELIKEGQLDCTPLKLGDNRDKVLELYSMPDEVGMFEGSNYYAYDSEHIVFYTGIFDDILYSIGLMEGAEVFDVEVGMTFEEIKDILGNPSDEGYNDHDGIYFISYEVGSHNLYFDSSSKDGPTTFAMFQ